jgi:lysyl-tRNA synthetase, class II
MTNSTAGPSASTPGVYRYDVTATAAGLAAEHGNLGPGTETGITVRIAGRLLLRRVQGKLAFGQLRDGTGRIQLFAPADSTPDFAGFSALNLGDWIGVEGEVMTTRKGELSVKVGNWVVLAATQRPFPDKWHGMADPDTRYRQRYVDLVVTDEADRTLRARSRTVSLMRRYMEDHGFMEVETPILQPIPGGALAKPFTTHHNALDQLMYLRIAPELYLKRLVVGGFERVFEMGRVFRNEGISPRHNPEFSMLEFYAAYWDYHDVMAFVEEMVAHIALEVAGTTQLTYSGRPLDLSAPWKRSSLTDLASESVGEEVSLTTPIEELRRICDAHEVHVRPQYGAGKLLLELYEKTTEHTLWNPTYVCDYPVEVSPLARDHRSIPGMTERFEAIVAGRELANGYSELVDAADQRARMEDQARQRDYDDEAMVVDHDYLRALEYGLAPTGGLGIGVDRLIMLLTDTATIRDVVLFPTLRPEIVE